MLLNNLSQIEVIMEILKSLEMNDNIISTYQNFEVIDKVVFERKNHILNAKFKRDRIEEFTG